MKVAIQCESPLLQRSLELFLEGNLSSLRQCDIVVRDKPVQDDAHISFLIGSDPSCDLRKPFSKAQLIHGLQTKLGLIKHPPADEKDDIALSDEEKVSFEVLERHIEKLTREYQANILKAVRAFYEK